MEEKANVLTHTYDLLLYVVPQLTKFPRTQKFVLADRIQNTLTGILELLVEAYFTRGNAKKPGLQQVNLELEKLRYLVRLAKDLHCLDLRRYEFIQGKINEKSNSGGRICAMSTILSFSDSRRKSYGPSKKP